MSEHILIGLAGIIILGIGAQWLAWRLRLPSILFLLIIGFLAGPITGFLDPNKLMGELLLPIVAISVAVILFEGGLSLKIKELREIGKVLLLLISVGALVTWLLASFAAYYILEFNFRISVLLGAILVVTGPTVIGPLLRHIRPIGKTADLLKWEGIVIDPIGAVLAVLTFEVILIGELQHAGTIVLLSLGKTILFGGVTGFVFAWFLILLLKEYWIPDYLHEQVTLTLVVAVYIISNLLQEESGLFAATLMGLVLYNQEKVNIKHIIEFKENLRILIISSLFILLAARLKFSDFQYLNVESLLFLIFLILIIRPAAVFFSTIGSDLNWREKLFLSWMAPRGIVAAAVSSIFALRLAEINFPQAEYLVPITFMVIVGTVAIYGLTATQIACRLKIAQRNPQGILFVGAHQWVIFTAKLLLDNGFQVAIVDSNRNAIAEARMNGIKTYHENVLSDLIFETIQLGGIGRLLALTPNDEVNSLTCLHFKEIFNREELYQLYPRIQKSGKRNEVTPQHLRGRFLFGEEISGAFINRKVAEGAVIKSTKLTEEFNYESFQQYYKNSAIPLFLITENKNLVILTADKKIDPKPEQTLIALVDAKKEMS